MSWGTSFDTNVFIIRQTFQNLADVEAAIEDYQDSIHWHEKRLSMYAAATPKDINELQSDLDELFEGLTHDIAELQKLRMFKDYLEQTGKCPSEFSE